MTKSNISISALAQSSKLRFVLLVVLVACFAAFSARADDAPTKLPPPVIAIVDIQRILQDSLASKSVQKQLDARRSKFQSEIEDEENGLRAAEQELAKLRDKLQTQAYADREQQLRQRFAAVEAHVQARRRVLDQSYTDAMNTVRSALLDIVGSVARERGANLAVVKQQALWTDQPLDITDEVLKRLDQKLPKVDVGTPTEPKS